MFALGSSDRFFQKTKPITREDSNTPTPKSSTKYPVGPVYAVILRSTLWMSRLWLPCQSTAGQMLPVFSRSQAVKRLIPKTLIVMLRRSNRRGAELC